VVAISGLTGDRGSVTAEFACVLPAALVTLTLCVGAVQLVGQQVGLSSLASAAARSLARGDSLSAVRARLTSAASGVSLESREVGDFVCATVSKSVSSGPFAVFALELSARNCALLS
jgi:hypothetical protein